MRVSHEAIYQSLYVQGRGALRRELTACLRTGRALRVPRARVRGRGKSFVTDEVMISERHAEAKDRAVPGHWEGDLILGLGSSAIGTLVERSSRLHDAAAPPAARPPRRAPGQERPGADRSRRRGGPRRDRRRDPTLPEQLRAVADLGPGRRDGPARAAADRHRPARSTSATRRARGSAAPTRTPTGCCAQYFPKRNRPRPAQRRRPRSGRRGAEHPSEEDPRLENSRRSAQRRTWKRAA